MPDYWEVQAAEWAVYEKDMESMSEDYYRLWIAHMESDFERRFTA